MCHLCNGLMGPQGVSWHPQKGFSFSLCFISKLDTENINKERGEKGKLEATLSEMEQMKVKRVLEYSCVWGEICTHDGWIIFLPSQLDNNELNMSYMYISVWQIQFLSSAELCLIAIYHTGSHVNLRLGCRVDVQVGPIHICTYSKPM